MSSARALHFWWITDIPTPYRNHSFERMRDIFPEYGMTFSVVFMAWRDSRRPWSFAPEELRYPWRLYAGIHPRLRGVPLHVNPKLLWDLRTTPADVIMVGGWASPSHVLAPWFARRSVVKILACESNPESVARTSGPARWTKRRILGRYDAFLVPQLRSLELLASLDPTARERPYILFRNIVDATLFTKAVDRARHDRRRIRERLGVGEHEQLWLCPARLAEEKGLVPFVSDLRGLEGMRLIIAGEGALRPKLEQLIATESLPALLVGQKTQEEMIELYAAADLFVLPSLRDPSPLSAVEACAAALPLLVSRRIGNAEDVVVEGENGFFYEVDAPATNPSRLHAIAGLDRERLAEMGRRSRQLYDERFESDACVRTLAEGITRLHRTRRAASG